MHSRPGRRRRSTQVALGYPTSLADLPPGDYFAQAVINVYEQVHRADGKTIWVHMNDGTIEFFRTPRAISTATSYRCTSATGGAIKIRSRTSIAAPTRPEDTEWVKHVSIQSPMLTKFWGRPIFIHATVLLPEGLRRASGRRAIRASTRSATADAASVLDDAAARTGGRTRQSRRPATESGYATISSGSATTIPRVICISLEQQTPYFPDSYSVNSANNGPYGDAIVEE